MSKREWHLFLNDIRESIARIIEYTHGMDKNQFVRDYKTFDAVMRNLQVIGEAVKKFPAEIRKKYPRVAWKKVAGLRDIVTHEYFGIDEDIIWDVIEEKIPELKIEIDAIILDIRDKGFDTG